MKPGKVVRFRLSPEDCLSVLDVLEQANVNIRGKSFNAICHMALSGLLQSMRQGGTLPEPDPFQFLNRVGPHVGGDSAKLGASEVAESIPTLSVGLPKMETGTKQRLAELDAKQNRTSAEQAEYESLCERYF